MPFWRYGFLPPPRTSPRVWVSAVPVPAAGELGDDRLVEDGLVHRRGEQRLGEVDAPDGGAGAVVEGGLRHRQAFFTKVSAPGAPGTDPLTRIRLRSASTRTTRSFLMVTRSCPMWPPILRPL